MICGVFSPVCYLPQEPIHINILEQLFMVVVGVVVISSMPWKWSSRNPLTTEKMRSDNSKATKWEQYERDGDRYYLQYRTVGDSRVPDEHAALNGTTLPVSHPFWDTHYSPNGWNCR